MTLGRTAAFGDEQKLQALPPPKIDHILLGVSNLKASLAFYDDFLGLRLKSQSDWFVMLESGNASR
jgi:catechol-2,3-dioxygenase